MSENAWKRMPRYKGYKGCKDFWALKIAAISSGEGGIGGILHPADEGRCAFNVSEEYMRRHEPAAEGYYIVYEDGSESFCPTKLFENSYTRIIDCEKEITR